MSDQLLEEQFEEQSRNDNIVKCIRQPLIEEIARLNAILKAREEFTKHLEESIRLRDDRLMSLIDPAAYTQFKRHNTAQRLPTPLTEDEKKLKDQRAQEAKEDYDELRNTNVI